jgi:hypothetical protein
MSQRILNSSVEVRRLSSAEAELWVAVAVETVAADTELRGRFIGPRCPGVSTVEVAYPLRPIQSPASLPPNTLLARAFIPEPNLWTEATPYIYEGRLELWQEGTLVETAAVIVGLKQPR